MRLQKRNNSHIFSRTTTQHNSQARSVASWVALRSLASLSKKRKYGVGYTARGRRPLGAATFTASTNLTLFNTIYDNCNYIFTSYDNAPISRGRYNNENKEGGWKRSTYLVVKTFAYYRTVSPINKISKWSSIFKDAGRKGVLPTLRNHKSVPRDLLPAPSITQMDGHRTRCATDDELLRFTGATKTLF